MPSLDLIPLPSELQLLNGQIQFNSLDAVYVGTPLASQTASYLARAWDEFGWRSLSILPTEISPKVNGIHIELSGSMPEASYELTTDDQRILIYAGGDQGVFYAVQTLLQITRLNGSETPNFRIIDSPRCEYRGMHLDVSRHFRPITDIKKMLDLMARFKMNRFHWHLVDDQGWRIHIDKYPLLTEIGSHRSATVIDHSLDRNARIDHSEHSGFYSKQDIKDIIEYASERHILVIPEIDLPGHSSALLAAYPNLACQVPNNKTDVKTHFGVFKHVLCNRPSVFNFLSDIFTEIAELFPGPYIHIGGDEVKKDHWSVCPECQAIKAQEHLSDDAQLHGYFIEKVVGMLSKLGKKAICWDDSLDATNLDSDVLIMSWLGEVSAKSALERGHKVVMTQGNLYFDFYQSLSINEPMSIHGHAPLREVYNFDPLELDNNILGAQANVWTEYIRSMQHLEYALLPRMLGLAEILWTSKDKQDWTLFKKRLSNNTQLLKSQGFNVSDSHLTPEFNVQWLQSNRYEVSFVDTDPHLEILFTEDESIPSIDSERFKQKTSFCSQKIIHARYFDPQNKQLYDTVRIQVEPHLAVGKKVTLSHDQDTKHLVENLDLLTNGQPQQGQRFQHNQWALIEGLSNFELTIDLLKETQFTMVSLGFDGALGRSLYFPVSMTILVSHNGNSWSSPNVDVRKSDQRINLTTQETGARYVKIAIDNTQTVFSHESESQVIPPIYIDEIVIK
ncbi:family 20 glycosylhydrolase [Arenicella sp. 4NH20-0111]|uniref:beta-N-acetylhexosaminidase n=1 Tax=Arenicella sp. 4NH20-0111 TaxID=3127648 RepID=UPI00310A87CA